MKSFALFVQSIKEGKEGKNVHIEHAEDEIINKGAAGADEIIDTLEGLANELEGKAESNTAISVKFDGAPAVIFGINPDNKKFFVGTKGVFAKDAKICYSPADVRKWYSGELAEKLIQCLAYLPEIKPRGVLQGDLMFTKGDVKIGAIEGEECYIFRPNTITYAIPVDSKMGNVVEKAQMGIVIHSSYEGGSFEDMTAKFGYDVSELKPSRRVWFIGATVKDVSGLVQFSADETDRIQGYLNMAKGALRKAGPLLDDLSAGMKDAWSIGPRLKVYFNSRVRNNREFISVKEMQQDFEDYYIRSLAAEAEKKSSAAGKAKYTSMAEKAQEMFDRRKSEIYMAIACYVSIHNAKELIIKKLNKIGSVKSFFEVAPGEYKVTNPEGFVAIRGDKAVKLVSRFQFSQANFNMPKTWDKSQ